jgi:glycosyltransferase involved in cell wall biosynthesis
MEVVWNGTSLSSVYNNGYSVAESEICSRLERLGVELNKKSLIPQTISKMLESGINLGYQSNHTEILDYDILVNNRLPVDYSFCRGYNIGFSYWETNRLPEEWIENMNKMDEIWTTSKWAKQVFIDSGVTVPIFAFNLGVDPNFYPVKRELKNNTFTFMSVGSPSTRKNSQLTVNAFLKLFEGRDNVRLLYKTIDSPDARIYRNGEIFSIQKHPQIDIVDLDLPIEDLAKLYDSADCVVYPTSGEGWGMLPFQAIAKGIPTICTNATACTEYAEWSVPLSYEWGTKNISGIYFDSGEWAEPNFDDLCDKMLYVYNNYDEVSEFTYNNAVTNYDNMTWDTAIEGYYERLCQISKNLKH